MPKKTITKRKRWRPEDIERAAVRYCIEGTIQGTERAESIPASTIRLWRDNGNEVWDRSIVAYRDQNNMAFVAKANKIIDAATDITLEKLPEATAQQAATIGAIYYDKQRLALSLPTSISGKQESITSLMDTFRKLSESHTIVPKASIIEHKD